MKSSIVRAALAVAGSLILASSGFAAIVTTGVITIPNSGSATGGISFPVPEFNPALGTLTDVSLDFTSNLVAQLDVLNITTVSQPFTNGSSSGMVTLAGPDGTDVSGTPTVSIPTGTANPTPAPPTFPYTTTSFPGAADPLSAVVDVLPSGNLSDYEGVGNANFTVSYGTSVSGGTGGEFQVFFGGELFATGGTVDATYTYTPSVPEPTSAAIIGVPLMALIARRRRA